MSRSNFHWRPIRRSSEPPPSATLKPPFTIVIISIFGPINGGWIRQEPMQLTLNRPPDHSSRQRWIVWTRTDAATPPVLDKRRIQFSEPSALFHKAIETGTDRQSQGGQSDSTSFEYTKPHWWWWWWWWMWGRQGGSEAGSQTGREA